jgi:hypothetical protein
MNIYYTAKDIEELAAKGIHELELGPNTSLTDFARETAEQLDIALIVDGGGLGQSPKKSVQVPAAVQSQGPTSLAYNKPRGCQEGTHLAGSRSTTGQIETNNQDTTAPVNRLVDLMGKIINRGD